MARFGTHPNKNDGLSVPRELVAWATYQHL